MEGMNKRHLGIRFKPGLNRNTGKPPAEIARRGDLIAREDYVTASTKSLHALPAADSEFLRRMVPRNSLCGPICPESHRLTHRVHSKP
jgi:hypothetical protein